MHVNPVHALLQILRTESQKGRPLQPPDVQQLGTAELANPAHAAKAAAHGVDSAWQMPIARGLDPGPDADRNARLEELGSRLAGHTSDAINRSNQEVNGRSWNYTAEKDAPRMPSHGDASANILPGNPLVVGVALPFNPSREDIRHALLSGDGWPEDWGEPLRARLLREEAMQESEPTF